MNPLREKLLIRVLAVSSAFALRQGTYAHGTYFPDCYLEESFSDQSILPTLGFDAELQRLLSPSEAANRARECAAQNKDAEDAAELAEAEVYLPALASYDRLNPPTGLPAEFQLYGQGAREWHRKNMGLATESWLRLLALPPEQRPYRSVWAAYMLGKVAVFEGDKPLAASYWEQSRELAAAGFCDSRHLAIASLGDTALLSLDAERPVEALDLYWRQYTHGNASAKASLQLVLKRVFLDPWQVDSSVLCDLASSSELRKVVTVWFIARGGPYVGWANAEESRFHAWLVAVSKGHSLSAGESDRWAWAAYSAGEWECAQRFVDAAPPEAPASEWVRALLLLRRGKLEEAAIHLADAARAFETNETHPPLVGLEESGTSGWIDAHFSGTNPRAKLGAIQASLALTREQYLESLRLFRSAHFPFDVDYVAERVLTVDELRSFVDKEAPDDAELRSLLARRLSRAGRFADARPYYSETVLPAFDAYVRAASTGYDAGCPREIRAAALWNAAQILYCHGMDLVGTALEPDFQIVGGDFQGPVIADARMRHIGAYNAFERSRPCPENAPLAASMDECRRYDKAGLLTHRFHYRYKAAELAMLAAGLSPDNDPTTANILTTAGNWLAKGDPESAQIFYKTLAIRCPNTELGQKAIADHWLPRS